MEHPNVVFLVVHIIVTFGLSIAQPLCSNRGTYPVDSNYNINLNFIISSLPSNITVHGGFYNMTKGTYPDKVYALELCRGDLSSYKCHSCINSTSQGIRKQCPNKKEAIMWGGECMVRYANRNFFAKMETIPPLCIFNPNNVSGNFRKFNETLYDLMEKLVTEASSGSSGLQFATGNASSTSPVYGLVQCTPDISQTDCRICLQQALEELDGCAGGTQGGRVLLPSCIVWFEVFRFYDSADTLDGFPPPPPPPPFGGFPSPPPPPPFGGFPSPPPPPPVGGFPSPPPPPPFGGFPSSPPPPPFGGFPAPPPTFGGFLPPPPSLTFGGFRPPPPTFGGFPTPPPTLPSFPSGEPDIYPPGETNTKGTKIKTSRIILIIVVPVTLLIVIAIACAIFRKRRLKQRLEDDDDPVKRLESLQFNFSTLKKATNNFCEDYKLGQGGFGSVYKGVLSDGQEIAVKRLSGSSAQGETEFKNEILLMANLQHRNLLSLVGFSSKGTERILVYEYLRNGSLDHFIFDPIKSAQLNWEARLQIIYGIAKGILYLHEDSRLKIIHRDLKASNVLLDEHMNPKISDFGMARLFHLDQTQETSKVAGTYGYMAPEYALQSRFSVKSDVFSFGVLILEIVSGKKNSWLLNSEEVMHLPSHAWRNWREGTASTLFDTVLRGSPESEMMRCVHIGLLCVQENVSDRPTMASVLPMLSNHSWSLPSPSRPAFFSYVNTDTDRGTVEDLPSLESTAEATAQEQSTERTEGKIYFSEN